MIDVKKALLFASALVGVVLVSAPSSATQYIVEETQSPYISCYSKEYVPARIEVNTRGKKVRGEQQYWETSEYAWNRVRNPSVYIQTRRVVEADHYTLVPTSCPH